MKLPIFLLCLLSQLFFFAFVRGEASAPTASLAAPLPQPPTEAVAEPADDPLADTLRQDARAALAPMRNAIAQAVLAGDLDAFLPDLAELATWRRPASGRERG